MSDLTDLIVHKHNGFYISYSLQLPRISIKPDRILLQGGIEKSVSRIKDWHHKGC